MPYKVSRRADLDLENVYRHGISEYGVANADLYYDGLIESFTRVTEYPLASRERPDLGIGLRLHHYGVHAIVYRIGARKTVVVVRVLHGRQDWQRHL